MANPAIIPAVVPPPAKSAPKGGIFVGSSGHLFDSQIAADIYLQDMWSANIANGNVLHRVAVVCVGWGITLAGVQFKFAHGMPYEWASEEGWTWGQVFVQMITVIEYGKQFVDPGPGHPARARLPPLPPLPNENQLPPGINIYWLNGLPILGHRMLWHHANEVRRAAAPTSLVRYSRLHYHKHHRREAEQLEPPNIVMPGSNKPRPTHIVLDRLRYTTQVQNCRRAMSNAQ